MYCSGLCFGVCLSAVLVPLSFGLSCGGGCIESIRGENIDIDLKSTYRFDPTEVYAARPCYGGVPGPFGTGTLIRDNHG